MTLASKNRSLPLTELANLFDRPADFQAKAVRQFLRPPGRLPSYAVAKKFLPEIFGANGPMLEPRPRLTGDALWAYLGSRADSGSRLFNWPVVCALSELAGQSSFRAVHREFDSVTLVGGQRVKLVGNTVAVVDGRPSLVCLDPRRANFLTASGVHVVQSLIHHLLRTQYPDLEELDIAVLQFPQSDELLDRQKELMRREIVSNQLGDIPPIGVRDLIAGIAETLTIFQAALRERDADPVSRTGTDDLFG